MQVSRSTSETCVCRGVSSDKATNGLHHALQGIMGSAGPVPRVTVTLGMPPPTTVQRYACNAGPPVCSQQHLQCPGWCTRVWPGRSLTHPLNFEHAAAYRRSGPAARFSCSAAAAPSDLYSSSRRPWPPARQPQQSTSSRRSGCDAASCCMHGRCRWLMTHNV